MDGLIMTYHYTMCGLDYVYLLDGFREHKTEYGEGVSIERADSLDRAIAAMVIASQSRIRGQEVRFLRSLVHQSQTELANNLGLRRLTVARWEGAPNTVIPGPADRALRIIVARELFDSEAMGLIAGMFSEIADDRPESLMMYYLPDEQIREPSLFPEKEGEAEKWRPAKRVA